jgi:hypothetical protein
MTPVGIVKMQTCFLGLNALRALHQDACDDLQAVGDPVLNFLKQHVLLTNEGVLLLFGQSRCRHVGRGKHDSHLLGIEIVELIGAQGELAGGLTVADKVHLIGVDLGSDLYRVGTDPGPRETWFRAVWISRRPECFAIHGSCGAGIREEAVRYGIRNTGSVAHGAIAPLHRRGAWLCAGLGLFLV